MTRVVVLERADSDYLVAHADLTKVAVYTAEAATAGGPKDASLGMLWHKLSELPVVTIAKIRGRARTGSELTLACDVRFATRENAILGQIDVGAGTTPGAAGVLHLARPHSDNCRWSSVMPSNALPGVLGIGLTDRSATILLRITRVCRAIPAPAPRAL